jgi:hypothetical protein
MSSRGEPGGRHDQAVRGFVRGVGLRPILERRTLQSMRSGVDPVPRLPGGLAGGHEGRPSGLPVLLLVLVLCALVFVLASAARAATFTVTNTANSGQGSLRDAIERANAGGGTDTITFSPEARGTIRLTTGQLTISSDLAVRGPGAGRLSVRGNGEDRVFNVASGASARISGLTVTGGGNGGINNQGTLTLSRAAVTKNFSEGSGGGISNRGTLTVARSTISGNTADEGGGGGVSNSGTRTTTALATITNSTVSGNEAETSGAGITTTNGSVVIRNSTVTKNTSEAPGGGLDIAGSATGASVRVFSSIIAGNRTSDVSVGRNAGPVVSGGYNLVGTGDTAGFDKSGDRTGLTNPGLGPLADNGGPTQTHAVLNGSPALDKGDGASVRDQRGKPRPVDLPQVGNARGGNGADVGAFERQAGV